MLRKTCRMRKGATYHCFYPPIEYFEDEELDAYRGRVSDSYTPSEVDDFEEVLTTMRPSEVADWVRSLQLRGVELPDELKDEVMMLIEG